MLHPKFRVTLRKQKGEGNKERKKERIKYFNQHNRLPLEEKPKIQTTRRSL